MDDSLLKIGSWFAARHRKGKMFRYEGRSSDGGYIFTRFNANDPHQTGDVVEAITVHNLDDLYPWEESKS